MPVGKKYREEKNASLETKRCPYCSTPMPANSEKCFACGAKVGKLGKFGLAKKPFDWKGYLIFILSFVGLGLYIWWAFFKRN